MTLFAAFSEPFQRWWAMRQMRSLQKQDSHDHEWDFKGLIFQAEEALDRDLRTRARELWTQAYARFPDLAMNSETALELLFRLGLYQEAEDLMTRAVKQYPRSMQALEGLATVTHRRGKHDQALRLSELLRKNHPSSLKGYWIGAASLSHLGRPQEAEALLAKGLQMGPDDLILHIEYARVAERRQDWDETLRRWAYVHETLDNLVGTIGIAATLARLGRYDEADAILTGVFYKTGNNFAVWMTYVNIAEQKEDWEEAATRWTTVRERFPLSPFSYTGPIKSLEKLGRQQEAEEILREGIERLKQEPSIFIEYAGLAYRSGNWGNVAERWGVVRKRFPGMPEAYKWEAAALEALHRPEEAASIRAMAPAQPA
jgi:tetratricopeptide (TPR) repeat protein